MMNNANLPKPNQNSQGNQNMTIRMEIPGNNTQKMDQKGPFNNNFNNQGNQNMQFGNKNINSNSKNGNMGFPNIEGVNKIVNNKEAFENNDAIKLNMTFENSVKGDNNETLINSKSNGSILTTSLVVTLFFIF